MLSRRLTGILGLLLFPTVLLAFGVLFILFKPEVGVPSSSLYLLRFNYDGMSGQGWLLWVCYVGIGLLITFFSALLFKHFPNDGIGVAAKSLLICCGLLWISLVIFEVPTINGFEEYIGPEGRDIAPFFVIIFIHVFGGVGHLLLANSYSEHKNNSVYKWLLIIVGILFFANPILDMALGDDYKGQLSFLALLQLFIGFGVIGISLIQSPESGHNAGS